MTANVDELAQARVRDKIPPGMVLSRLSDQHIQHRVYGLNDLNDKRCPDPNTVFEIGSNTKVFTALLCARLAELGMFCLNDPIRDYLPASLKVPQREDQQISFIDLLSHTSGLPPMPTNFDISNAFEGYASYGTDDLYEFVDGATLNWDIGKSYVYSNLGYAVLGHIIELVTKRPWDTLIHEHICDPLNLTHTSVVAHEHSNNIATPHQNGQAVAHLKFKVFGPAGALKSTANDAVKFLASCLGQSESALSSAQDKIQQTYYRESDIFGLALGWHIQTRNQRRLIWHRGETQGQTSFFAIDREAKTGSVMLSNCAFGGCSSDLAIAQIDPLIEPTESKPHDHIDLPATSLAQFAGVYNLDSAIALSVEVDGNRLKIGVTGQNGGTMYPVGANRFETKDQRVVVTFPPSDTASKLCMEYHGIERIARRKDV